MIDPSIAAIIGSIISAIAAIIITIIQNSLRKQSDTPIILVPEGYKVHRPKKHLVSNWLLIIIAGGAIGGYLVGILLNNSPANITPTEAPTSSINSTTISSSLTPDISVQITKEIGTNNSNRPFGHIVFSSNRTGYPEIYIMNADGTNQIQITSLRPLAISGRISSDGRRILIGTYPVNKILKIYIINIDGSGLVELATINNGIDYPFWDSDSKHAYFSISDGFSTQLYKIDVDTGKQTYIANYNMVLGSLSISPDGNFLVFQQTLDGQLYPNIFSIDINGNNLILLSSQASFGYHAIWSPDGQHIAFASENIWVMNSDGSNQIELPTEASSFGAWSPSWSPDGNWIAFNIAPSSGEDDIYIIRTDGTGLTKLTNSIGNDNGASWGP